MNNVLLNQEEMLLANQKLITYVARNYLNCGLDMDDLISYGQIGLIKAVEGFKPELGYQFSTYAMPWIRQAIRRGLEVNGSLIRIPYETREKLEKENKGITVTSLDAPINDDGTTVEEGISDENAYSPEESVVIEERNAILNGELEKLSDRECDVLKLRNGYDGECWTLEEIGRKYNISKERVRQIEKKALMKLRRNIRIQEIADEDMLEVC